MPEEALKSFWRNCTEHLNLEHFEDILSRKTLSAFGDRRSYNLGQVLSLNCGVKRYRKWMDVSFRHDQVWCVTQCVGGGIPLKNPNRFMRPAVCFTSLTLTLLISSPLVQVQHLGCSHYHSCLLVHAAVDSNQRAQLFERRQYASDIFRLFSHSRSRTDLMSLHFKPISKWNAMKLAHF